MEIRDPIHGSMYFSDAEVRVLDAPEFQRLRAIKQLGFAEFSFPGATHNRYIHSIGVCHLAGLTFDSIFRVYPFSKTSVRNRFRQTLRLASLLHDIGHGPLSHTTEQVMPFVNELNIKIYNQKIASRKATHEDYTIKYITDSELSKIIQFNFNDIHPRYIAYLIDRNLACDDDFFIDNDTDFRPILSQLVSSELDVDRMDYLERDSFFCGTNYGKIDLGWIVQNLTFHRVENKMLLGLNKRALYSFDDFLISRHHMHLMVYCHHKSIIYEEMLNHYLTSKECDFRLPAQIEKYTSYNDYKLYEHLALSKNEWARRLTLRTPYRVLIELHNTADDFRIEQFKNKLKKSGLHFICTSSKARLSKYHLLSQNDDISQSIYVMDQYDRQDTPVPIRQSTEIFKRYEGTRIIDRIYVAPEYYEKAEKIISESIYKDSN